MYNYIDIDLRNGADDVCSVYSIGRDSENLAAALRLFLPDKYLNCSILFEFEISDGSKYTSKPLHFEAETVYPLQSFFMVEGLMKIAVVLTDVSSQRVMKPFERTFVVSESINALSSQGYNYVIATDHENRISKLEEDNVSGTSGFSPIVEITEIEGGHGVTITDVEGTKKFEVFDGEDGEPYILTEADKKKIKDAVVEEMPEIDLSEYAKTKDIPTKTSDLKNDSGFITKADIPTDESYELIGQTPLTLENGGSIKLVADGETNYEMKTPTVWNFDDFFTSGNYTAVKCVIDIAEGHYKVISDETTTAHHQSYIKILIPVEANKKYTLCWDNSPSKGDIISSPIDWGGMISVYDTDTSTLIKSGIVLDDLTEYEFTPTTNVVQIRYYPARNNYTPYAGSVLRFGGIWLNEGNSSTELTEIYNASGTFEDMAILQNVPIGTIISSTPTVSVYRKNPTDKTLTQSDVPADAESTGNAIKEVKALLPLYGKTIVNFGDSIFGNKQPPNDISTFLAEKTGATVYNCGFGGCRMSQHVSGWDAFSMYNLADSIANNDYTMQETALESTEVTLPERFTTSVERLKSIDFSSVDIVTIAYGSNDFSGYGADLDNEENLYDTASFGGALRYSIETLLGAYPNLRIFVLSIAYRYWIDDNNEFVDDTNNHANNYGKYTSDYNAKLREVAGEYNLPYVDDYNIGINKFNRLQYFGATDPAHHQIEGRKLIAEHLAGALTSCTSGGEYGKRPTAKIPLETFDGQFDSNKLLIYSYKEEIPTGTEIADVEVSIEQGAWISLNHMFEEDPENNACWSLTKKAFYSEMFGYMIAAFYIPNGNGNFVSQAITNGLLKGVKVTYYTD